MNKLLVDGDALGDRFFLVRYEDLILDKEEGIRKIFQFVGASCKEGVVEGCLSATDFFHLSQQRKSSDDGRTGFFREGKAQDWKNHLNRNIASAVESVAKEMMTKFGYL